MKKFTIFIWCFVLIAGLAFGQTPMFFNTSVAGGANVFPWGSTNNKVQWCIPAGSLGGVTPGNNITKVWFQSGGAYSSTYPIINIRLKTGTTAGLTGAASGPWEPGMTLVYTGAGVVVTTTSGQWFGFTLNTPWLYDPTLPLFVEVEQSSTSASQSVYQAVNITGAGNGRQWGTFGSLTIVGTGLNQVNFGIDVIPAVPCTGVPPTNTLFPSSFTACPGTSNPNLTFASTYSFGGLTYQWNTSTVSPVGPFTPIPGSTLSSAPIPTLGITTWYQAVVTCTNPGGSTVSLTPSQYYVGPTITSSVPYYEDFENIQINDRLPNCSWWSTTLGTGFKTYTASASGNRLPHTGSKFAAFSSPGTNDIVYTNGIQLQPGITYSAGLWFATEYYGYSNFNSLSILVGASQIPTGLVPIASAAPAISGAYKDLGGTFTVSSPGLYYIAVRANSSSGSALYLSWDDLSVTIPCTGAGSVNAPVVTLSAGSTTICAGDQISLNANGADSYAWNNGATSSGIVVSPINTSTFTVVGTNSVTGCTTAVSQIIYVNPSPTVFVVASKLNICPGEITYLNAYGALSYAWSNGSVGNMIGVSPSASTTYSAIGTNNLGCARAASVLITVKSKPTISAISSNPGEICAGEVITISATGGLNYQWTSSSSSQLFMGSPITVPLKTTTTFTVIGEATNGCTNFATVTQNVAACTGIAKIQTSAGGIQLYPNPTENVFTVESANGDFQSVELTDISGRMVLTPKTGGNEMVIDISSLANGVYYAKISTSSSSEVVKVIKK